MFFFMYRLFLHGTSMILRYTAYVRKNPYRLFFQETGKINPLIKSLIFFQFKTCIGSPFVDFHN